MDHVVSMLSLVDEIYEAARGATAWSAVAATLAERLAAEAVGLRRHDPEGRLDEAFAGRRLTAERHASLLDHALSTRSRETTPDPAIREGAGREGSLVLGALELPSGTANAPVCFLSVPGAAGGVGVDLVAVRAAGSPPFGEELALLRPLAAHLVRASEIERDRVRAEDTARCLKATAHASANAALVVDGALRIRACNTAAERLLQADRCFREESGQLVPRDAEIRSALARALGCPSREPITLRSAPGEGAGPPCLVLLQPLENAGSGDAPPSRRLLIVTSDEDAIGGLDPEAAAAFFGVTRAEFRLAQHLASGTRLDDAARALGISLETARTYLKALFRKTGTARQAALVRLLLLTPRAIHSEAPRPGIRPAR